MRTAGLNRRLRLLRHRLTVRGMRRRRAAAAAVLLLALACVTLAVVVRIQPLVVQMAEYSVGDVVTQLVNETIAEKMSDGSLDYNELVTLETDLDGSISALKTNMAKVNMLQTEITTFVIEKVSKQLTTVIKVPLGNILGGAILSGRGPSIPVRILSVTNVSTSFENEFLSAGINQTRHQIILNITVDTEALLSGRTITNSVTTGMVVAETVIVGAVPSTYANLKQGG